MEARAKPQLVAEHKGETETLSTTTAKTISHPWPWGKIAFWSFIFALFITSLVLTLGAAGVFGLGIGLTGINGSFATIGTLGGLIPITNTAWQIAVGVIEIICPVFIPLFYLFGKLATWCSNASGKTKSTTTTPEPIHLETEKNSEPTKPRMRPREDSIVRYPDDISLHMSPASYTLDTIIGKLSDHADLQNKPTDPASATLKTWGSRTRSEEFLNIKDQYILVMQTYIDDAPVTELIIQNFGTTHLNNIDLVKNFFEITLLQKMPENNRGAATQYLANYFHTETAGFYARIFSFLPNYVASLPEPYVLVNLDNKGNSAQSCTLTFTTNEQGFSVTETIIQKQLSDPMGNYLVPDLGEADRPYDAIFKITETLQFDFINVDTQGNPTITPIAGEVWYGHSGIEKMMQDIPTPLQRQTSQGAGLAYVHARLGISSVSSMESPSTTDAKADALQETPETPHLPLSEPLAPTPSAALSLHLRPQ